VRLLLRTDLREPCPLSRIGNPNIAVTAGLKSGCGCFVTFIGTAFLLVANTFLDQFSLKYVEFWFPISLHNLKRLMRLSHGPSSQSLSLSEESLLYLRLRFPASFLVSFFILLLVSFMN